MQRIELSKPARHVGISADRSLRHLAEQRWLAWMDEVSFIAATRFRSFAAGDGLV
jgi:hypothetical protein